MAARDPLSMAEQLDRARGSLNELHRSGDLDTPTLKIFERILSPSDATPLPKLTDPSLEPAKAGEKSFPAVDSEGYIAVFKDRRNKLRRNESPSPPTSSQSSQSNQASQPNQSNPDAKERPQIYEIDFPMATGGSVKMAVTEDQRDAFVQRALKAQDKEQEKKDSEILANKANSVFAGLSAVLLVLGIIFGIRAEMRPAQERTPMT